VELSEYKQLFLSEADEILSASNNILVELEKEPSNRDLLNDLFRQSHTLKSMAQSMGYEEIARLSHSMEATLSLLRTGTLKAEKPIVDLLFRSLDALGELIAVIKGGEAKKVEVVPLVERFEKVSSSVAKGEREPSAERRESSSQDKSKRMPEGGKHGEVKSVRIPLVKLDNLMDIAGELSINKIRLMRVYREIENSALEEAVAQISRLISQLQDQMMQIRLVPLEYIFTPYPRLVRDMAVNQHKEVDLIVEGSEIGLDRSIQDEINEPLLHLLKNAVIHGIEEPEERERLKKHRRGKIKLIAKRERNFVRIELSDDGQGIDIDEIKDTALSSGIITKEELSALSPEEITMLITYPGFSKAKKVTEAAGRGVGLNASRIKVESLGGTLNIVTKLHERTVFIIKLPLTMAIVQATLVDIANEVYCIPSSYIAEAIRVLPGEIRSIEHNEMISHRDTVLPLIRLRDKVGFPKDERRTMKEEEMVHRLSGRDERPSITPYISIVIVEAASKKAGLVVDSLLGQQDVVVKPLTGILSAMKNISGATILGTGKVALIVDVPSLF
jgi:two-component system chemotaxis sensor kinase CheA